MGGRKLAKEFQEKNVTLARHSTECAGVKLERQSFYQLNYQLLSFVKNDDKCLNYGQHGNWIGAESMFYGKKLVDLLSV